ncbi:MAG: cache domain-containing protein [Lentisphaerae bacterium]|nr:cache domain-containing protein [Lentisphaerota bacterium]
MLRTKIFKRLALVVVLFAVLSILLGVRTIQSRVLQEAQTRVRLDLSSAWAVYDSQLDKIRTIVALSAAKQAVIELCAAGDWDAPEVRNRLDRIRVRFGLDYLGVTDAEGQVRLRTTPPYAAGDYRTTDPVVAEALNGKAAAGMQLLSSAELAREAEGLREQAFLELENTPRARRTTREVETRGMVMTAAAPVTSQGGVTGVVYGGLLVNRNFELIDRIHEVVYGDEMYEGAPLGTATVFLHDSRIATTVRRANGNRALGTRVSKEVADRVLDNGEPWIGEAFVVRDWYLTAYEPIRDGHGEVIGMLYVGILKEPFVDYGRSLIWRYVGLSAFVLVVALVTAFLLAGRLAAPIHRLVEASNRMKDGSSAVPVPCEGACSETEALIHAFNGMTRTLAEREERLRQLNRSYMETLGFVSHELKSPVASIMNYVYLLREGKLGSLNEKQQRALRSIDSGGHRLVEMVRHYLNLSRIENGELSPAPATLAVRGEVVDPVLEALHGELEERGMRVDNRIGADVTVHADGNMIREVFENLLSNALKYGRAGGAIELTAEPRDGFVEFCVRNEGDGIPPDKMDRLFTKFSRLEDAGKAGAGKGTGLGLFITRHVVEAHGGTIRAESEYGRWAAFRFTLPAAQAAEEPA